MMYVKLSLRSLRRSIREYGIYMITMILASTLMYSFNCVVFSKSINEVATNIDAFQMMLVVVSIFVVMIIGWLVYYISNFIQQKRSREFGMYLLMGMTKGQIARMFLLEQLCMGLIALAIGCFLGVFFYQFLELIIMNTFSKNYVFSIELSKEATLCTFIYFICIYALELLREQISIRKKTVYKLLYSDKQNEQVKANKKRSFIYFFLFLILFPVGLKVLDSSMQDAIIGNDNTVLTKMMLAILFLTASIYFFFFGISTALRTFMNHRKKLKYKKNTMFLYTQIAGRLRSNRIVLATLSMLTLLTFVFVCLGFKFGEARDLSNDLYVPYEIFAYRGGPLNMDSLENYLDKKGVGYESLELKLYQDEEANEWKTPVKGEPAFYEGDPIQYIRASDYQKMRELKGLEPIAIAQDEFVIVTDKQYKKNFENYAKNHDLQIGEHHLKMKEVNTDEIGQNSMFMFFAVIPDNYVEGMKDSLYVYIGNTDEPTTAQWYRDTQDQIYEDNKDEERKDAEEGIYTYYRLRGKWLEENAVGFITIAFCLFYLALIFVCIDATILATQQLSDSHKQRYSYQMLWKMGMSRKEMHNLLAKQVAVYFLTPLLLPFLYIMPLLFILDGLFSMTIANAPMYIYLGYSLLFFGCIYGCYFILTYIGCRRNIDQVS